MAEGPLLVGLVIERLRLTGPWAEVVWIPVTVLVPPPATPPWTLLSETQDRARYYAGAFPVEMHRASTAQYRENLEAASPSLWVVMRPEGSEPPVDIACITADTSEGEGYTETGTDKVETVAMPLDVAAALARFVEQHHVERPFEKRKRDRVNTARPDPRRR